MRGATGLTGPDIWTSLIARSEFRTAFMIRPCTTHSTVGPASDREVAGPAASAVDAVRLGNRASPQQGLIICPLLLRSRLFLRSGRMWAPVSMKPRSSAVAVDSNYSGRRRGLQAPLGDGTFGACLTARLRPPLSARVEVQVAIGSKDPAGEWNGSRVFQAEGGRSGSNGAWWRHRAPFVI